MTYARQDIVVTRALYRHLEAKVAGWGRSVELEHRVAWAITAQEQNGFWFDTEGAERLYADLRGAQSTIEAELQRTFPPITKSAVFIPKVNNKARGYIKGVPFTKTRVEVFEPGSRKQIGERLMALGWKPRAFGANGLPTVDEGTIARLPYPEAQPLIEYLALQKRIGMLAEGDNAWLKMVQPDHRIHGRVNTNGAVTGRMSHMKPNVAQADKKDARMRALWLPKPGWKLVGCDAEGLEARMLAHYLTAYDGGAFTKMLLEGDKSLGTDVHSANRDAVRSIGHQIDRDGAKTLLYALMYGAGDVKLGTTIKENLRSLELEVPLIPNKELGMLARRALARSMKGIDKLTLAVRARAKTRGYLVGLDGRQLPVRSEHSALNTLLQSGGAVVMKAALVDFMDGWIASQFPVMGARWGMCGNIHDEVEMEVENTDGLPEEFGRQFADSITRAGVSLGVRCPLAGAWDVGDSWAGTH